MRSCLCCLAIGLLLVSCVPAAQVGMPNVYALEKPTDEAVWNAFSDVWNGFETQTVKGWSYKGKDPHYFQTLVASIYRDHPGFCPAQQGFFADPNHPLYLTVLVHGTDIVGFFYDQSESPGFTYLIVTAKSQETLAVGSCPEFRSFNAGPGNV